MLEKNYQEKSSFGKKNLNFENIWNTVDLGICVLDIVNHGSEFCVVGFNAEFAKISPVKIEYLLGKTLTEAFPLEIACSYSRYCTECLQSGRTVYFEQHFQSDDKDTYFLSVVPLKDYSLHISQLLITATNITREIKFRQFIENVTDLVYSIAPDGTFTYLSPQFTEVWGYDIPEFLGKSFATIVHSEDLPNLNEFFHHILDTAQ
ncbi:MAG: PAS domain S-box protein, partial [Nostocaceae cyanobacterium]|nr:PAS domain S-box protein [Nostocaceae cyanobacterium]